MSAMGRLPGLGMTLLMEEEQFAIDMAHLKMRKETGSQVTSVKSKMRLRNNEIYQASTGRQHLGKA